MSDIYADSVDGDDGTGDGSSGNPYQSLLTAVTNATDNDTIYLVPQGSSNVYSWISDSIPAGLTIKSTSTLIDRPGYNNVYLDGGSAVRQWSLNGDFTMEDIYIQNVYSSTNASPIKYPNVAGNSTITFNRCVIDETQHNLSTGGRGGFVGNGNSVSLGNPTAINTYFNNCRISNFTMGGGSYCAFVHQTYGITFTYFQECTIYNDSSSNGEKIVGEYTAAGEAPTFRNCIIRNEYATDLGIYMKYSDTTSYSGSVLNYCNYTGLDATNVADSTLTSCTTANPLFRDPSAGDYNIQKDSTIFGTGLLV